MITSNMKRNTLAESVYTVNYLRACTYINLRGYFVTLADVAEKVPSRQ